MIGLITSPSMSNFFATAFLCQSPSRNPSYISKAVLGVDENNHSKKHESRTSLTHTMVVKNSILSEYDIICRKILGFSELENDWDGYDGVPATVEMTEYALNFLSDINAKFLLPKVTLANNGSISFYWKSVYDKSYIEVELDHVGSYNYLIKKSGEVFGEEDVPYYDTGLSKGLVTGLSSYLKYYQQFSAA